MVSLNRVVNVTNNSAYSSLPISLTTHRRAFYPADYLTNDGYCPYLSKKNPKLGHYPNCSESLRRAPKLNELQSEMLVLNVTQRRDETLRDAPGEALRLHFKQELLAQIPKDDAEFRFKSCAVVGNSGTLYNSSQGWEIDARDAVMRMNYAPTAGFEKDVGSRTTFDFVNQQHTKAFIPRVHTGGQAPESLRAPLRNSTITLFEVTSPFARYHLYAPLLKRFEHLTNEKKGLDIKVLMLSPGLVAHTHRVWSKMKRAIELGSSAAQFQQPHYLLKPMTGFFASLFAMQVCEEVHMYGFSPYKQRKNSQFRYHYFDEVTGVTKHHSFDLAYEMMRQLALWPCSGVSYHMHD